MSKKPVIQSIDAKTAKKWLDKNEAIIIDVREPEEYATSHISGATLLPLATIDKDKLPETDKKKIIIHCQLGKRGGMACEKLLLSDPNLEIYNLEGGIIAWQKAGFKVERWTEDMVSVERQIPIIAGSVVLFGVVTGYLISSIFLLLAAAAGGALLYSGLEGTSRLENILKKMPWNQKM